MYLCNPGAICASTCLESPSDVGFFPFKPISCFVNQGFYRLVWNHRTRQALLSQSFGCCLKRTDAIVLQGIRIVYKVKGRETCVSTYAHLPLTAALRPLLPTHTQNHFPISLLTCGFISCIFSACWDKSGWFSLNIKITATIVMRITPIQSMQDSVQK